MAAITVIVPVYKVENYLRRCIDSILNQSFRDFELILVDDGSPDKCPQICDSYALQDNRIKVIHQENGGAAAARNAGLDLAKGEWIAFVDSDDWVNPDYLSLLHEAAARKGADIIACRYLSVDKKTKTESQVLTPVFSSEDREEYWVNDRVGAVVPWGKLYRRDLYNGLRYPAGRTAEDEYVSYKLLFNCNRLIVIDNTLYYYFTNAESVSRNNYLQRLPDILEAFRLHEVFFRDSQWQRVYRMEAEYYAAAWSDAIWMLKGKKDAQSKKQTKELRNELKQYLSTHKALIPVYRRKDIYISAYPRHELFIRCYGLLKRIARHE